MIFSEIYGIYYQVVAKIIQAALEEPVTTKQIRSIVSQNAFGESVLNIEPSLYEDKWQILLADGRTPIINEPSTPLSRIQKSWLNAIALDPRIRLFTDELPFFEDVEPLFEQENFLIVDRYADGDPFTDEKYIQHFRTILEALRKGSALQIIAKNRNAKEMASILMPSRLEYSEKDDKFRLIGMSEANEETINLARILSCEHYEGTFQPAESKKQKRGGKKVVFELYDRRNALERVLLHFAHFAKEVEKIGEDSYRVSIQYNSNDESEILIRILSFGPMVKVVSPGKFIHLIKERLIKQRSCRT